MKLRSGSARKKLNAREEAEGTRHTSVVKDDQLQTQVLKADPYQNFNELRSCQWQDLLFCPIFIYMKLLVTLLLIFFFHHPVLSQNFIGDGSKKIRKKLQHYITTNNISAQITETADNITLYISDSTKKPAVFKFNMAAGKCFEEIKLACDSCIAKYANETLRMTSYGWKKMNDSTFISKYSKHMMMIVLMNGSSPSLRIVKTTWDRRAYNAIKKSS